MNIFNKVHDLGLANNEYVVVAGGVLVALGLLEWDEDIDMAVSPEVFARLKRTGWRQENWKGKPVLKHDVYDVGVAFGDWDLQALQADAMWINDTPFMSLDKLLEWKKQMGREKDLHHVALIEAYMQKHPKQ